MSPLGRYTVILIGLLACGVAACEERDPVEQAEISAIEEAGRVNDQNRRAILDEQVASGEMTEDEAACAYRQGIWDDDLKRCFDADDPAIRHFLAEKSIATDVR